MSDGRPFAFHAVRAAANLLDPAFRDNHLQVCQCMLAPTSMALSASITRCADPTWVVKELAEFDWKKVCEYGPILSKIEQGQLDYGLFVHFGALFTVSAQALKIDNSDRFAKQILEKLGSSDKLCRAAFRLIASGSLGMGNRVDRNKLNLVHNLLTKFFHCLVVPTSDREFLKSAKKAAVKLTATARSLSGKNQNSNESRDKANELSLMLSLVGQGFYKRESDGARWSRFENTVLSKAVDPRETKKLFKGLASEEVAHGHVSDDQMCAKCFAVESQLGRSFMRCSRCRQVYYCGKDCQLGHWSSHKLHCK